ncbi:MAG: hypothetical protein ACKOCD_06925 [Nitrospiraceae bacterium]
MAREWIIFAICLGLGGHIALGLILHAPDLWSWQHAGLRGLLISLGVYVAVQVVRSLWWVRKGRSKAGLSA